MTRLDGLAAFRMHLPKWAVSLRFDTYIILKTFWVLTGQKNAY